MTAQHQITLTENTARQSEEIAKVKSEFEDKISLMYREY